MAEEYCLEIVWDRPKRLQNLDKHGLDFASVDVQFLQRAVIVPAAQGRFMAIGRFERTIIAVVFARLGTQGVSLISMRPASRKERALHGERRPDR